MRRPCHWDEYTYSGILSYIAEQIDNITKPVMMPGRIYSSRGTSIGKISEEALIVGSFLVDTTINPNIEVVLQKLLQDKKLAKN